MSLPRPRELERLVAGLLECWGVRPPCPVRVGWNRRLRTTAGRAFPRGARIELNPVLLAREPDWLQEILAHEAAHLAVHWRHGRRCRPHGPEWRALMHAAGHAGRTAHGIQVHRASRRRFLYLHRCERCGHHRIAGRVTRAACAACGPGAPLFVLRASRSPAGRRALLRLALSPTRGATTLS